MGHVSHSLSSASRETQSLGCLFVASPLQTFIPHTTDSEYMFLLGTAVAVLNHVRPCLYSTEGNKPLNRARPCVDPTDGNGGQERAKPQVART